MDLPLSRSEQKRRIKQLEKLVVELAQLPAAQIKKLPCSDEVVDYLKQALSLKGGAKKRTLKYVTKLLRSEAETVDALYDFLANKKGGELQDKKDFHELEYIRDSLLNEAIEQQELANEHDEELEEKWNSKVLEQVAEKFPEIDVILLGRLAWLFVRTRNRRHSREIFRILRATQEQQKFASAKKI